MTSIDTTDTYPALKNLYYIFEISIIPKIITFLDVYIDTSTSNHISPSTLSQLLEATQKHHPYFSACSSIDVTFMYKQHLEQQLSPNSVLLVYKHQITLQITF